MVDDKELSEAEVRLKVDGLIKNARQFTAVDVDQHIGREGVAFEDAGPFCVLIRLKRHQFAHAIHRRMRGCWCDADRPPGRSSRRKQRRSAIV